jgi:hypothetical protein
MAESQLQVRRWHTGSHPVSGMPDEGTLHEFTFPVRANTPSLSGKFSGM